MIRATHNIDANGKILGRLATEIATLLRGKNKVGFTYHQDLGDKVVVVNAEKVRVTGRKASQKMYYSHSGHPGSLKETNFEKMQKENPEKIIYLAVRNMLPDNKLRALWLKRLEIKKGNDAN